MIVMDYVVKLNNGQPLSKVFTSFRETPYRNLYIVSARKKDALLHYSDEKILFLSEWYDKIEDFDNYIYSKIYHGELYNYIYPTGKLVSPYWSDEMNRIGQTLWSITFNGKYNFIKDDGSLLLSPFAEGIWIDDNSNNSFIIGYSSRHSFTHEYSYRRISSDGKTEFMKKPQGFDKIPVVDVYSSKSNLTDKLIIHRRLFSSSIEDLDGKELLSGIRRIIEYNVKPISDLDGISEGDQGILFSVRKQELAGKEEILLFYDFVSVQCEDGYRVFSFSTESFLPDTFEDVQVLRSLLIKVRKNGVWNIIDKYGDYLSKDLWFDSIDILNNGNAIVKKGSLFNFLKSNGIVLSSEWYDEIIQTSDNDKFIVRKNNLYNIIDRNLRLASRKWQETTDGLPKALEKSNVQVQSRHKSWPNI